jgi:hypothetical protein
MATFIRNDLTGEALTAGELAAFEAGREANYEGLYLKANPHLEGSREHRAWMNGHIDAQQQRDEWEEANG